MEEEPHQTRQKPIGRLTILAVVLVFLVATLGLGWYFTHQAPAIPQSLVQQLLFPVYRLDGLPSGYSVDTSSYQVRDGALIFTARDEAGSLLSISQQAKPGDFDFTTFYQKQLIGAKTLPNVPYVSVYGHLTADTHTTFFSLTTDRTWIIVTTRANLSSADYSRLARYLIR